MKNSNKFHKHISHISQVSKNIIAITTAVLLFNCSSNGGGSDDGPGGPVIEAPTQSTLIEPANNEECTTGTSINATQSSVTFRWNASDNTDSYDLVIKNLNTDQTTTIASSSTQSTINIDKATPYSWYVISKSNSTTETATSTTWKFYNAGDAIQNYAPFPAELVAPTMGANLSGISSITLEWTGSDVDNDIAGYDVYFDTVTPPATQAATDQTTTTLGMSVTSGNTYYWKVITKDAEGNNSESPIFEFKVD